ncbi:MAG: DUF1847 domain-containing protein [Candidatus Eisenbacteria bacterium]|nr:DUF1847 domain-containing protein [Candidatus Eisenbacteria bacterium]
MTPRCARCETKECSEGQDCFGAADEHRALYDDPQVREIHRAATAIEGRHYLKAVRLEEIILFGREIGATRIGLVFCVGLSEEARLVDEILRKHFDVVSVCCKACGIDKADLELEQIDADRRESICNSAGQADLLNRAGTDLNVICGLCVGHDAVFSKRSEAPVTTLIAKDRVLAHNPAGAVYCQYLRRRFEEDGA